MLTVAVGAPFAGPRAAGLPVPRRPLVWSLACALWIALALLALAAAALDFELEIYFIGESLLQLAAERDGTAAHLPPGYRAWAALPGLCKIRMFGEREWVRRCERGGIELAVPVEGLDPDSMRSSWRTSRRALVV